MPAATLPRSVRVVDDPGLTLILGGARSGKSAFAQEQAARTGDHVLFVATGVAADAEMVERIAAHRASRPATWQCVEAPTAAGDAIRHASGGFSAVLVDCMSFLVSNRLMAEGAASASDLTEKEVWPRIDAEIADLLAAARSRETPLIVVSNEVGMAVVPEYPLGRLYRDVLGRANQMLAREAERVYLMVAGIPVDVRSLGITRSPREL
jgi:adenosylcobinamide kinase/adenosylcobinamide-phosphate guanylyltransferase